MKNTNYSVKKYQTYGILLLALLFCGSVEAKKVDHYVGGYAQVGEWSLLPSTGKYGYSLGAAGGLGFLYELQYGKPQNPLQMLFDVGVGATYGATTFNKSFNVIDTLHDQFDMRGREFDYIYDIRNRKDQYTNLAVHIPIMIGVQYHRIYALVGVKIYANMMTQINTTAKLTTYGVYWNDTRTAKRYDDIRNIPEYQFFTDEPLKKSQKTHFKLDADLSVEVGARLGVINYSTGYDVPKRKLEYRVGAFLDYGLFDVHTSGKLKSALNLPKEYNAAQAHKTRTMIDNVQMNDVMRTKGFAKKVQNLMVGVKFTILFQMPEQQKCVMCADGYQSATPRPRGSRGMQYEE